MGLATVFMVIGAVWLTFRKWIARRQYSIATQMLGRKPNDDERCVKALEQLGTAFCVLLLLAGLALATLQLVFRR
jgi:hypothetical protein